MKRAKEFMKYINELLEEDDYIIFNKKPTLKEERKWINDMIGSVLKRRVVFAIAEHDGCIVGSSEIRTKIGRESHVGSLGVIVRKEYRGIGIGTQLIFAAIGEAKGVLKAKPKIIELEVFETNKNAQNVYQNLGFKKVAELHNRIQRRGKLISKIIMEKSV